MPDEKGQSLEARLEERASVLMVQYVGEAQEKAKVGSTTNQEAMLATLVSRVALNEAIQHELLAALRDNKTKWASAIGKDIIEARRAVEEWLS